MVKNSRKDSFDGKAIRTARKKMRLSQVELAEGITTQATISLVENQNRVPNADVLLAILDRLNLEISEFVSGDFLTQKAKEFWLKAFSNSENSAKASCFICNTTFPNNSLAFFGWFNCHGYVDKR